MTVRFLSYVNEGIGGDLDLHGEVWMSLIYGSSCHYLLFIERWKEEGEK
jgi:hypothetical protein